MKIVAALWNRGLIPVRVLPICLHKYDPFWWLAYHISMWEAFGGTFDYRQTQNATR